MEQKVLVITEEMKSILSETAKWAKLLAIVAFIMFGFMILMGITLFISFASIPENSILVQSFYQGIGMFGAFFFIIIAIIMLIPYLYLYRFSIKMQTAIRDNNEEFLLKSFQNHKSFYKFIGIFTIIMLVINIIPFIFAMLGLFLRH